MFNREASLGTNCFITQQDRFTLPESEENRSTWRKPSEHRRDQVRELSCMKCHRLSFLQLFRGKALIAIHASQLKELQSH